ncbi:MAG TPA: class I SAM-dependent methyltransferase [Streptosporangiaceae bacterium]|nr:class I SAM-dependent methyltransferase [Streptosporangiaceae bacterium]
MTDQSGEYRIYRDLAQWWPLISPPQEYAAEANYLTAVLRSPATPVRGVLDLGSGGGHVAVHLKDSFTLTLVDISADMLAVSRELNPECVHVRGDMRTLRLGRVFDAVLVHDAIDYITTVDDLRQVIGTAFTHCRPGGIAVFVPDYVKETFDELTGVGGGAEQGGQQASFRERTWDPDPADDWVQAEYEFTLREADGTVQVVRETHRLGAFSRTAWLTLLAEAGFEPLPEDGRTARRAEGRRPDNLFVAIRRP